MSGSDDVSEDDGSDGEDSHENMMELLAKYKAFHNGSLGGFNSSTMYDGTWNGTGADPMVKVGKYFANQCRDVRNAMSMGNGTLSSTMLERLNSLISLGLVDGNCTSTLAGM